MEFEGSVVGVDGAGRRLAGAGAGAGRDRIRADWDRLG